MTTVTFPSEVTEDLRHSRMARARIGDRRVDSVAVAGSANAVVGAGTLGSMLVPCAAATGMPTDIFDPDVVGPETLGRSVAFLPADVGRPKATALAARARALNPGVASRGFVADARLSCGGAMWERYDAMFLLTDNITSRADLASVALRLPKGPQIVLEAGLAGFDWSVQVMGPGTACYACGLDEAFDDVRLSCNGVTLDRTGAILPTTLPAAASTAGLMVQDALVALSGGDAVFLGREVRAVMAGRTITVVEVPPRRSCRGHVRLTESEVVRVAWTPSTTIRDIRRACADRLGVAALEVSLAAPRQILSGAVCLQCGTRLRLRPTYLELFRSPLCACGNAVSNTVGCRCGVASPEPPRRPYRRLECARCGNLDPDEFDLNRSSMLAGDHLTTHRAGLPDEEMLTASVGDDTRVVLLQGEETRRRVAARAERSS